MAAIRFKTLLRFSIVAVGVIESLFTSLGPAIADIPPPPVISERDSRSNQLDAALRRLLQNGGPRIRVTYVDKGDIHIVIPKSHQGAAESSGLMALADKEVSVERHVPGVVNYYPFHALVAGLFLSAGFALLGIMIVRGEPKKVAAVIVVGLVGLAGTVCLAAGLYCLESHGNTAPAVGQSTGDEQKILVRVSLNEQDGPVEITVPRSLRPGMTGDVVESWPPWRPGGGARTPPADKH